MEATQIWISISVIALGVIAALIAFLPGKTRSRRLTPLAGLAFGFILAGIFFSEEKMIGYGLIITGVVLSVIDIIVKFRKNAAKSKAGDDL
jgi:hypothetical protein